MMRERERYEQMCRDVDEYSRLPTHPLDDNYDWIGYKLLGAGWQRCCSCCSAVAAVGLAARADGVFS